MPLPINFSKVANSNRENHNTLAPQSLYSIDLDLTCRLPYSELTKLHQMIETALPDRPSRVVQFASAYEDEGVNQIAFEMAIIAARLIGKRVLFIDTAPAQMNPVRSLADDLNIPLDLHLLTGRPPHEAIVQIGDSELYIAVLREREMGELAPVSLNVIEHGLESLRGTFDLIIVNSQAILKDAFGMAFAKLVDGSVLIVEAERTRAPAAEECKRLVEAGGGRLIGAVLNRRRFYIPNILYRLFYRDGI